MLHLLTKRRQDLVAARIQTINRLHRLLIDLVPGGARRNLTAKRAAVEARIKAAVAQSKTTLVGLFGVGPVLAVYRCLLADHAIVRPLDPAGGTRVRMGDGCSHGLVLQPHLLEAVGPARRQRWLGSRPAGGRWWRCAVGRPSSAQPTIRLSLFER